MKNDNDNDNDNDDKNDNENENDNVNDIKQYSNWFIRTVYYCYFFLSIYFAQKNTQALFKYLNTPKKHNKEHKQLSFRCKAMNFCSNICLKKYS